MYGFVRIAFDQSACVWPPLLTVLTQDAHQTLTYVMQHTGYFAIPLVLFAYDQGARIVLGQCDYVTECWNPFEKYVPLFAAKKNRGDAIKALFKVAGKSPESAEKTFRLYLSDAAEGIEEQRKQPLTYSTALQDCDYLQYTDASLPSTRRAVLAQLAYRAVHKLDLCEQKSDSAIKSSAETTRNACKLTLNGLPGKLDQKVDRTQTLFTQSETDLGIMEGDKLNFREVSVKPIDCDGAQWARVTFREGGFREHIANAEAAPYLAGYMLAYSKIMMGKVFVWLAENGCTALYTDTDSVAAVMTTEKRKEFEKLFCPEKKTLGGLEIEGLYDEFRTMGPKKYAAIKATLRHIAQQLGVDISAAEAKAKTAKARLAGARSKDEREEPERLLAEATKEATELLVRAGADPDDLKERVFGRVMEWKANGVQAHQASKTKLVSQPIVDMINYYGAAPEEPELVSYYAEGTMWETFGEVLDGKQPVVNYFRIGPTASAELQHTVPGRDDKKTLRFLSLKGKCVDEDGNEMDVQSGKRPHRIQWWKDEFDFQTYAMSLKAVGFDHA